MQILTIAGNVGNVKPLADFGGDKVLNFSVAVDNGKDKNGEKRDPTWFDCALWGKRAESLAPYIEKGGKLAVSGRPGARAHDGKAYLSLTVDSLTLMGPSGERSEPRQEARPAASTAYDMDDDIPF